MIDPDYISFEQSRGGAVISVSLSVDADLTETVDAFRAFLLAVGHHPDNVRELFEGEPAASGASL